MSDFSSERSSSPPLVTAIVVCYNQARWVREALDSVAAQTYPNLQVLIFDDASTDNSVDVIQQWLKERGANYPLIVHSRNLGVCATLNEAISQARGEFVELLAADDVWFPEKTLRQVQKFENAGAGCALVYSDAVQIDEDGNEQELSFITAKLQNRPGYRQSGNQFGRLVEGNFIPAPTTLVRLESYRTVGAFDESLCYEDWDMWLRLSRTYDFAYSDYTSAKYRFVSTSLLRRSIKTESFVGMTSNIAIAEKCFKMPGVSEAERSQLAGHATAAAEALYRQGHRGRGPWMRTALDLMPSARGRLMHFMSAWNVPYAVFRAIDAMHSRFARS